MAERKKLTSEQLDALRPYEKNMETAIKSDWTRGIGTAGLRTMARIRKEASGGTTFVNMSCPVCVLELVRQVGRWYFEDKDAPVVKKAKAPRKRKAAKSEE